MCDRTTPNVVKELTSPIFLISIHAYPPDFQHSVANRSIRAAFNPFRFFIPFRPFHVWSFAQPPRILFNSIFPSVTSSFLSSHPMRKLRNINCFNLTYVSFFSINNLTFTLSCVPASLFFSVSYSPPPSKT